MYVCIYTCNLTKNATTKAKCTGRIERRAADKCRWRATSVEGSLLLTMSRKSGRLEYTRRPTWEVTRIRRSNLTTCPEWARFFSRQVNILFFETVTAVNGELSLVKRITMTTLSLYRHRRGLRKRSWSLFSLLSFSFEKVEHGNITREYHESTEPVS